MISISKEFVSGGHRNSNLSPIIAKQCASLPSEQKSGAEHSIQRHSSSPTGLSGGCAKPIFDHAHKKSAKRQGERRLMLRPWSATCHRRPSHASTFHVGGRMAILSDGVQRADRVSLRTGSGVPAAGPSIIPLLIGEARPEGGVIRSRSVGSPSNRPGLLASQSGSGGLVECPPHQSRFGYCYCPEGVSLPRLIFIE
jgi:hypothetical protein